jgi:hypothetical protein
MSVLLSQSLQLGFSTPPQDEQSPWAANMPEQALETIQ